MRVAPRDDGLSRPSRPIPAHHANRQTRGGGSKDAPDNAQSRSRGYGLCESAKTHRYRPDSS